MYQPKYTGSSTMSHINIVLYNIGAYVLFGMLSIFIKMFLKMK